MDEEFETELVDNLGKRREAFLPSSPEFAMKKMLSSGSGSIFQITKSFRNGEGRSPKHNPEFTILEWYEVSGDYMTVVEDFERLLIQINQTVRKLRKSESQQVGESEETLEYQGKKYSLRAPWERISVAEAFLEYAGVDEETMLDGDKLKLAGRKKGYQITDATTWEEIWNQIIANEVEPRLGQKGPTVLYDYPVAQAALAKKARDPRYAERAEVYLAGVELGNIFPELTDWREQESRCEADLAERKRLGKTEFPMDRDFIEALKWGMPETGGIAVGVDRLAMLFADTPSIADTLFFPVEEMFK